MMQRAMIVDALSTDPAVIIADNITQPLDVTIALQVVRLLKQLAARHGIDPRDIVAHADVSPGRKHDPGRFFPWERLHREHGVGVWPDAAKVAAFRDAALPDTRHLAALLRLVGYQVDGGTPDGVRLALTEFQRHWRPDKVDGRADRETVARLRALLAPR